jgi:hypothetical protein
MPLYFFKAIAVLEKVDSGWESAVFCCIDVGA